MWPLKFLFQIYINLYYFEILFSFIVIGESFLLFMCNQSKMNLGFYHQALTIIKS